MTPGNPGEDTKMPQMYDELEAQARELTTEERARLAQALVSSLSAPRSREELMREVSTIAEGRIGFTVSDRKRMEELLARPLRARDRRIDDIERRLGSIGARIEILEARVVDGEAG